MMELNRVSLLGRLGADPELKTAKSGAQYVVLSVATHSVSPAASGSDDLQKNEKTHWHRVLAFGKLADHCTQFLKKGEPVMVEGMLRSNPWEDKEGKKRVFVEISAEKVIFLSRLSRPKVVAEPEAMAS